MRIILSLLLFLSFNSFALFVKAEAGLKWNEITIDKKGLLLTGHNLNMSIDEKKCTSDLIERFRISLHDVIEKSPRIKNDKEAKIVIIYKKEKYSVLPTSTLGRYLKSIPSLVQNLKLKESFRKCD